MLSTGAARAFWLPRVGAAAAGGALALAFPEPGLWWWAYLGLVPIILLLAAAGSRREAVWRSWLAASGFFGVLQYWLLPHLSFFALPVVAAIGVVWVPWGVVTWSWLRPPVSSRRVATGLAVLPAVWLVTEYARSWEPLGGSWSFLGSTQWSVRPVLPVAALGGVWAVSLVVVVANVAVAFALAPLVPRRARLASVAVAATVVLAAVTYGSLRGDPAVEDALRIGGVQPGVVHGPGERLDRHVAMTRRLVQREPSVDVVVWGQSSVGFDLQRSDDVRHRLLDLAGEVNRQIVVNVDARRVGGRISKSAVVVEPDGRLGDTYRKQRLVPFGEYVPLRPVFGWVDRITKAANEDRAPGTTLTTFDLAGARVGPLISYESTFPDLRRSLARREVSMTLVQAAATTFQGTSALPQQASYEAVQAVASGRPAVLVAVSGTSSAFDPRGRRLVWIPQTAARAWTVEVPLSQERTLFVRLGPWVPIGAIGISALAGVVALSRNQLRRRSGPDLISRS